MNQDQQLREAAEKIWRGKFEATFGGFTKREEQVARYAFESAWTACEMQFRATLTATQQAAPSQGGMRIGGKYNWKGRPERLVYLGRNWSGNGYWHQFALVGSPTIVWCEVLDADLPMIEETATLPEASAQREQPADSKPDCGEFGHADGACGNVQCMSKPHPMAKQVLEARSNLAAMPDGDASIQLQGTDRCDASKPELRAQAGQEITFDNPSYGPWLAGQGQAQAGGPRLEDIEQYRLQMAGISTAAIGYWKESDGIHPDYDTRALRDVAKLYAKYDALYQAIAKKDAALKVQNEALLKSLPIAEDDSVGADVEAHDRHRAAITQGQEALK